MAKTQVSVHIDASPERVWAALEDIESHAGWMLDAESIRFTSRRRRGVGTAFDCATRIGPLRLVDRMTVTEWRPRRAMGVDHVGLVSGTGRFTLRRRRRGRATRLTWTEQLRFPVRFGGPVGAAVARPVLAAVWRRNLANFKRLVEGDAAAATPRRWRRRATPRSRRRRSPTPPRSAPTSDGAVPAARAAANR